MSEIVRVRLKRRGATKAFPFPFAYVVPEARRVDIYRLFGPAFSVPLSTRSAAALGAQTFRYVNRQFNSENLTKLSWVSGEHYIVVPLQHVPNSAKIRAFTRPDEPSPELPNEIMKGGSQRWLEFRREYARHLSAEECMLHLGPNKEDTQHICTHCPNTLSHMIGHCTPGESACTKHLVVPVDAVLRLPAGRPRRTADEGR